ncbi:N-acetylmuramoyl-L-alanine amidase [Maritimibacter sp. DP1N21-5]|uniref:N-acetylmuramoyl-L-alanine amidase n=1 Tax=Roseobacteraceae TaxID=2854170 RepID=UPI00351CC695
MRPTHVVLHYTAMATAEEAIERLCDPTAEVSAHYVICKSGSVTQLVPEGLRAWHAGAGEWDGLSDINSRSIGIELDNDGQGPFAEPLMQSLEGLLARILAAWAIPARNVIGHSDMAPGRKFDPGPFFDWARLEARGLAARPVAKISPSGEGSDAFRHVARVAGYTADASDEALLAAVRLRHRPVATGPLDPADFIALKGKTRVST